MKNILILLFVGLSFTGVKAQSSEKEVKINNFLEAAIKEFQLDNEKTFQVLEARQAYMAEDDDSNGKSSASNGIGVKKEKSAKKTKEFIDSFSKITGKSAKEVQAFMDKMIDQN